MTDAVNYHCANTACAREFPGQVTFCPFCGTGQPDQAPQIMATAAETAHDGSAPATAASAAAKSKKRSTVPKGASGSESSSPAPAPSTPAKDVAPADTAVARETSRADESTEQAAPAKTAVVELDAPPVEGTKAAAPAPGDAAPVPVPPVVSGGPGPGPKPGRKKWPFVVGAVLGAVWLIGSLGDDEQERLDQRVAAAFTMAAECRTDEVRSEIEKLQQENATSEQISHLQKAIREAAPECKKKQQRAAAWSKLTAAADRALESHAYDKATAELNAFTRRWKEDDETRALRERIEGHRIENVLAEAEACLMQGDRTCVERRVRVLRASDRPELAQRIETLQEALRMANASAADSPAAPPAPPPSAPALPTPPAAPSSPDMARNLDERRIAQLLKDATQKLEEGNYKGAADSMALCLMLDADSGKCQQMKSRAERLNKDMLACVASGSEWMRGRCQ